MAQTEIDALRALLQSLPRPQGWLERRARMDAICGADSVAGDIAFEPGLIGTIPIEYSLAPGSDSSRLLVYFHGGGYCSGSIASHRHMVSEAGRAGAMRTLAVAYRLAPEHPFPAALEDALAVLRHLVQQGWNPRRIALGGDSAGGGLSLAAMLALRDAGEALPGCAWLISPWVDLAMTGASMTGKDSVDPLIHRPYLQELAAAYLAGESPHHPFASPLHADLTGLPPLLVQVGSSETLLDDAVRIARRAGSSDVSVTLQIWPQMIHAWPIWAARLKDGRQALTMAGEFLRRNTNFPS